MKFKFGDLVYHKPTTDVDVIEPYALQVLGFDARKKKYKCIFFTTPFFYEVITIWYCAEDELDYLEKIQDVGDYLVQGTIPFPDPNVDDSYLEIYDVSNKEISLIRKPIRERKPFQVPLRVGK